MLESSTNGAQAADEVVAGREDKGGVAELGFGAGGRASPAVAPDPDLVGASQAPLVHRGVWGDGFGRGRRVQSAG